MSKNVLLSVIIPIYKVEAYLKQCVDSVLMMGYMNMEVLLIDDGSPDSSPAICDEYARKDDRIRVFHKKNGGLSDARNYGIKHALGKYIMFLDSDDYWDDTISFEKLTLKLEKNEPDILIYGCRDFYVQSGEILPGRTNYNVEYIEKNERNKVISYLMKNGKFPGAAWLICVRRDLLIANNLFFKVGITAEDYDWLLGVFLHASHFAAVDDMLYIYRYGRSGAITNIVSLKRIDGIIYTLDKWIPIINQERYIAVQKELLGYLCYMYCSSYVLISKMTTLDRKCAVKKMNKYKFLLKYGYGKKVLFMKYASYVIGMPGVIKLISIRNRWGMK